jgi:CheY-like chemotaxis protein
LFAEDNLINREIALAMLDETGYDVTVAGNGHEVLAALADQPFDAILMDCQMPEMDGFQVTRMLRRQEALNGHRRTPIIALTANAMEGDRERCLEAGMDDYLAKPFSRDQLLLALGRWTKQLAASADCQAAADANQVTEGNPVDACTLQALRALQSPGRPNIVSRVIDLFNRDAPRLVAEMRSAAARGTSSRYEIAHTRNRPVRMSVRQRSQRAVAQSRNTLGMSMPARPVHHWSAWRKN